MIMMMMIDDIRVRVTVMIDTASRIQGETPRKTELENYTLSKS